jgi:hypothetical protein
VITFWKSAGAGRRALQLGEGICRALDVAGIVLLGEGYLLGREAFFAHDCGPGRGGVTAAQKLLVDLLVARAAIAGGHLRGDDEAFMFLLFLGLRRPMAVQAGHALGGVLAHFEFVDDGVLLTRMALRAFARGANERSVGLLDFDAWSGALDEESTENQRKRDDDGHEHGAERHFILRENLFQGARTDQRLGELRNITRRAV